jgi:hypothetical protein
MSRFLDAFAKLGKAAISFVMSVRPSVRLEQLSSHWTDLHQIWYFLYFSKLCRENSSFIKIGQKWRVLYMKTNTQFWSYVAQLFLAWEIFQRKVVEKIRTPILSSITVFENHAIYEICGKILQSKAGHRQHGACAFHAGYLRLQTNVFGICNTYCFSTAIKVSWTRVNVKLYVQYLPC